MRSKDLCLNRRVAGALAALALSATSPGSGLAAGPVHPRMVLQTVTADECCGVPAWTPDSRFVVTGTGSQLILWDRAGVIVDRLRLPPMNWDEVDLIDLVTRPGAVTAFGHYMPYSRTYAVLSSFSFDWTFGHEASSEPPLKLDKAVSEADLRAATRAWISDKLSAGGVLSPDGRWTLLGAASAATARATSLRIRPVDATGDAGGVVIGRYRRESVAPAPDSLTLSPDGRRMAWRVVPDANDAAEEVRGVDLAGGALLPGRVDVSSHGAGMPASTSDCAMATRDGPGGAPAGGGAAPARPPRSVDLPATWGIRSIAAVSADGRWALAFGGPEFIHAPDPMGPAAWSLSPRDVPFMDGDRAGSFRIRQITALPDPVAPRAGARSYDGGAWFETIDTYRTFLVDLRRCRIARVMDTTSKDYFAPVFASLGDNATSRAAFALNNRVVLSLGESEREARRLNIFDTATGARVGAFGTPPLSVWRFAVSPDGKSVAILELDGKTTVFDIASGDPVGAPIAMPPKSVALAYDPARPLLWAQGEDEVLHAYDRDGGAERLAFYPLGGGRFFVLNPEGRYDTNLPPDSPALRWQMSDAPLRSLAAQTFMRDFYTPGLLGKILACAGAPTAPSCLRAFRPVPDLARLNRVLPTIRAMHGVALDGAHAAVTIDVADGYEPDAPNRKTRSGVYDLRLFRDGALVGQWPRPTPALDHAGTAVAAWRRATAVPGAGPGAVVRHTFTVALPTDNGTRPVVFTAYAFNEDRVKGETYRLRYAPPAAPKPGPRRAFVLSIGVNRYDHSDWALRFAAPDAVLMSRTLKASLTDYDVRTLTLLGQAAARQATFGLIHDALTLLGRTDAAIGGPTGAEQAAARRRLTAAGLAPADVAGFETATPDDAVIITYAGHGWTSEAGEFYLAPLDGKVTPDGRPNPFTFISAGQLTDWLRPVDSGETAIVIDACHSAASVEAAGFRPAPLGDAGLGQLAYDKGIRILAASQADAVAMEDEGLGHGLLTYALAAEALGSAGGRTPKTLKADMARTGGITLDAWLGYAARRLPSLSEAVVKARLIPPRASGDILFDPPAPTAAPPAQQPQLFDFTGKPSTVVLH